MRGSRVVAASRASALPAAPSSRVMSTAASHAVAVRHQASRTSAALFRMASGALIGSIIMITMASRQRTASQSATPAVSAAMTPSTTAAVTNSGG